MANGFFPSAYESECYYATDYWPDAISTALDGALLNAGYWPDTYFARSAWPILYWPKGHTSGSPGRDDYQYAWERLQKRGRENVRIHRDDAEMLELLTMFTGQWDC